MTVEHIEIIPIGTPVWLIVNGEKLTGDIKAVELVKDDTTDELYAPIYFLKTSLSQGLMHFKLMDMYATHEDLEKKRGGRFKGKQLVKYQILTEGLGDLVLVYKPVNVLTSPNVGGTIHSSCAQGSVAAIIVNIDEQSLIVRYDIQSLVSNFRWKCVSQNEITA